MQGVQLQVVIVAPTVGGQARVGVAVGCLELELELDMELMNKS